jgi:four helix bundle protein
MHRDKELQIWNRAIKFTKPIYTIAKDFPEDERFGLVQQIKRAMVSVSLNIAEGAGRGTDKDFSQFFRHVDWFFKRS